jgi:peptidoglycan/LPS O-acetylase OafA/YrhL
MRIRRTLPIVLVVVIVVAAVTLTVQLRKHAPPEPARLLPGADAFLYANFNWIRKANGGRPFFPVAHDPEYDHFIEDTGFDFERDLD